MSFRPLFHLEPRPHRELSPSTSSRKQHIRFTYDILHVCLQRNDLVRARRAWSILVRCPEIDLRSIWQVGLALIPREGEGRGSATREHVSYLKRVKLQVPVMQETLLKETVLALIDMGQYQEALDELDLYIVTMPFDQNAVLHLYTGMLWLHTSQSHRERDKDDAPALKRDNKAINMDGWDTTRVASAKRHFRRAIALDPGNSFARGFLERIGAEVQETEKESSVADDGGGKIQPDPIAMPSDEEKARPIKKPRSESRRRV